MNTKLDKFSIEEKIIFFVKSIDNNYKSAFLYVFSINILAFGFELTNLSLHHDDVGQIFIQDHTFGYHVGRFGLGWIHYYMQSTHFMPFLQMIEGIIMMSIYSLIISHVFGLKKTLDIVVIGAVICVFPFMGQTFQYNSAVATYPLAHLFSALSILYCIKPNRFGIIISSLFFIIAFSIYQSVIANSATLFLCWLLIRLVFDYDNINAIYQEIKRPFLSVLFAVSLGGLGYIAIVNILHIHMSSYQGADEAFSLSSFSLYELWRPFLQVVKGSRSFYFWPENYFPLYLKYIQLFFIFSATIFCLILPKAIPYRILTLFIFGLALVAPRSLQFAHPDGNFHNLTLTAYAIVVAAAIAIVNRKGKMPVRNVSILLSSILILGYVQQCNWISTINYLNDRAHYATLTQMLARVRSLSSDSLKWDGKRVAIFGSYNMPEHKIFKKATGVASNFIRPQELQDFANLLRDEITFIYSGDVSPRVKQFAESRPPWPHPNSVGIIDGIAVLVLSK